MKDFSVVILGTDNNSYTAARSYYEAFQEKPIVCGSAVLMPFQHTKIAKVYTRKGFSSDSHTFTSLLNEVVAKEAPDRPILFLVPNEDYLFHLYEVQADLKFPVVIPYPSLPLAQKMVVKSEFYQTMEEIGVRVPHTAVVTPANYRLVLKEFPERALFMKAANYSHFQAFGLENYQKGYFEKDKASAQAALDGIYKAGYRGRFILQEFVTGGPGTEYSITGMRAPNGKISMVQARALLSDQRPRWVGNHLLLIDSDDAEVFATAEEMMTKLDYTGFFNIDFKRDANTGELFVFECNPRLGRSFHYTNLAGVNLIEMAVNGERFGSHTPTRQKNPFAWYSVRPEAVHAHLLPEFLPLVEEPARKAHSGMSLFYDKDNGLMRKITLGSFEDQLDRTTFEEA